MNERPFLSPTPDKVKSFIDSIPLYRDDDDPSFWSDGRLRDRRNHLLCRQLGWLVEASPFYRQKFAEWGVDIRTIRTTDDLQQFPVTTKQDLMAEPDSFRLRFEQPTLYDHDYFTVYTTGTTSGKPTRYIYTGHDFLGVMLAMRRTFKLNYTVPGDCMMSIFPISPVPHVAMFPAMTASAAGVHYVNASTGSPYSEFLVHRSTASVLDQIEAARPQVITGIASFVRRILAAGARQGRDLSSIYLIMPSGETITEGMLNQFHRDLAACGAENVFICNAYGFTEGGASWSQCHEFGPLHGTMPDQFFIEILDPDTYERVPDGEPGLVALTHLNRRGMPLLRYLLGDISSITHERCPKCGRGGESLLMTQGSAHITRTKGLVKIKGVLVNPACIHEVVTNTPGVLEYQSVLEHRIDDDPFSGDRLTILVCPDTDYTLASEAVQRLKDSLQKAVFNVIELTPEIVIVNDPCDIYDPEQSFKATRFIDMREQAV